VQDELLAYCARLSGRSCPVSEPKAPALSGLRARSLRRATREDRPKGRPEASVASRASGLALRTCWSSGWTGSVRPPGPGRDAGHLGARRAGFLAPVRWTSHADLVRTMLGDDRTGTGWRHGITGND